uniref:Menorin-like domain-containing protein n=1 Tax=Romanomermis culicivorax TaxID=13658 RepID=A0A915L2Z7_ROMCU
MTIKFVVMYILALVREAGSTKTKFRSLDDRSEVEVDNAENLRYVRHVNDINMLEKVLKDSAKLILQVNVLSKRLVQPVLQYLSAMKFEIGFPVIIHGTVRLNMNEQLQDLRSVEPYHFADLINSCTASNLVVSLEVKVGTKTSKYTWRQILDVAEFTSTLDHKSIIFQVGLSLLSTSLHQLTWLISSRSNSYLTLRWRLGNGFEDLMASAALMKYLDSSKIFFDLPDYHRSYTIGKMKHLIQTVPKIPGFESNRVQWHRITKFSPIEALSTALPGRSGVALMGYPSTILSTDLPSPINSTTNNRRYNFAKIKLKTTVFFSPKEENFGLNPAEKTGFTLYFSTDDSFSKSFDQLENRLSIDSIRLSLKIDGEFFIENLAANKNDDFSLLIKNDEDRRSQNFYAYYAADNRNFVLPEKSSSVVEKLSDCFDLRITVDRTAIYFTVIPLRKFFCPGNRPVSDKDGFWSNDRVDDGSENDGRNFLAKTIKLPIRSYGQFKKLYIQKSGHWSVDCLVFDFKYNSSFCSSLNVLLYLLLVCYFVFQS